MNPRATYRLQFHKDFTFSAGAELAAYLADLGISHVYASPILHARPGSMHGYDVIDHSRINPELGSEPGFRQMYAAFAARDIGIILDIVPNHMAVGNGNRQWLDVLEHGADSRFVHWFDINFAALRGKILLPLLESPCRKVLAAGKLRLVADDNRAGKFCLRYHDHVFPIRPEDCRLLAGADLATWQKPATLHALLQRQHYRLAWWRSANAFINWRRFFDITDLAGLSVEHDDVFDAVHDIPLRLYAEGLIDGLRIDHVDGLTDPGGYCRKLRRRLDELTSDRPVGKRAGQAYLLVEKILAFDERLRDDWQTDGTTGYDFLNAVSALQHDPAGAAPLADLWSRISHRTVEFEIEERAARLEIVQRVFVAQTRGLALRLAELARTPEPAKFFQALHVLLAELRVYRSYAPETPDQNWEQSLRTALARAEAVADAPVAALRLIAGLVDKGRADPQRRDILRRLHQLTAPVAAKAVEDTAFYRYGRLLSRNDVGASPGIFTLSSAEFHRSAAERRAHFPRAMLATATHDHKRGEDIRARLAILSEIPTEWQHQVQSWVTMNHSARPASISSGDEYQLYQMLVGAWPLDLRRDDADGLAQLRDRLIGWQRKSLREAKLSSSWLRPNVPLESAAADFLTILLSPAQSDAFLQSLVTFVDRIAPAGALNGLVQATLRNTLPGVPDIYQGTELWDFTLVDPDNRRPVDFVRRTNLLHETITAFPAPASWRDGRIKQALIARLLALRKAEPALFMHGDYRPLSVKGRCHDQVLAFSRSYDDTVLLVIVPIRGAMLCGRDSLTLPPDWWGDTRVHLPGNISFLRNILHPCPPVVATEFLSLNACLPSLPISLFLSAHSGAMQR